MALILSTDRDLPLGLTSAETWQVYNGLDCAITHQALEALLPLLSHTTERVYAFQRELQVLALEMMTRGLRVDETARKATIVQLEADLARLHHIIQIYAAAIWGKALNPNSHHQMKDILYTRMKLPPQYAISKEGRKLTTNREALEKLILHFHAAPLLHAVMAFADARMLLQVLNKRRDFDGRMRFSFNVGATETGRWSSSVHPLGSGTNGQNITDSVRRIFVPDPGYIFCNFDLVTAESLGVAYFSRDEKYKAACLSGDLHTQVTKLIWPGLPWIGNPKGDRAVADEKFYRHFTYRDMAKRGGHLSNYLGQPRTMAMHLRLPLDLCKDFQSTYFTEFSSIPSWHTEVQAELQINRKLTTPLGRVRQFFGRSDAHDTLKEAIAFLPQSTIVDIINTGALRLWKEVPWAQFLMQVHDSILVQIPIHKLDEFRSFAKLLEVPVPIHGDTMTIGVEMAIGLNWSKRGDDNPQGLRKVNAAQPIELDKHFPGLV